MIAHNAQTTEIEVVAFDMDGTLTDAERDSWFDLTVGMGASLEVHKALWAQYVSRQLPQETYIEQLCELWHATGNAHQDFIQQVVTDWRLRNDALPTVQLLRDKNMALAIVTGGISLYARIVSHELEIEHLYANANLIFDSNGELATIQFDPSLTVAKVAHLRQLCEDLGTLPNRVVPVGDAKTETGIFEATQNGVLIGNNPDPKLRKAARWCIQELSEIPDVLTDHTIAAVQAS